MCALTSLLTILFGVLGIGWLGTAASPPQTAMLPEYASPSLEYVEALPILNDGSYVGRTCADPAFTADVPSMTNWVLLYRGAPIDGPVQLITEPGGVWHYDPDQPCDAESHWPLGVVRSSVLSGETSAYFLYAAPFPDSTPSDGQSFRLIVDGVEVAATVIPSGP
jgi:hypothetical protein